MNDVFVYDGCYSPFRRRRHGSRVGDLDRTRFVVCLQNHDQVGNGPGRSPGMIVPPAAQRLACGLLLLSPCVPLLFMGEEYGEQRPFPFFCSFGDPAIIEAVRRAGAEFAGLRSVGVGDPRSPRPRDLCRGQARVGMAGRLAQRGSGNCIRPAGGPPPVAGAPRPAAHGRPTAERAPACCRAGRPCWCSNAAATTDCWPWQTSRRSRAMAARLLLNWHGGKCHHC